MKLISVLNYEIGNGIEAKVEKDGKEYIAYLQLPNTADSQHSFLDNTNDDDLLQEIVNLVEKNYSQIQLNIITFVGHIANYETFTYKNYEYYVIIDENENFPVFKENPYSNYYNKIIFENVRWFEYDDEDVTEIKEKVKEITDKYTSKE